MPKFVTSITTAALFIFVTAVNASADTREECQIRVEESARITEGAAYGGAGGAVAGAVGCGGLAALAIIDWGFSYLVCTATVTAAGTGIGARAASKDVTAELLACERLPSREEIKLSLR